VFRENALQAREIFSAESCHPLLRRFDRRTARMQPKKDLSLSYRNMRGEKTTRFFGFFQNFFGVRFLPGQHERFSLIPAMAAERIIEKQPA